MAHQLSSSAGKNKSHLLHQNLSVWGLCSALLQDSVLALGTEIHFGIRVQESILLHTAARRAGPSSALDFSLATTSSAGLCLSLDE